eukprot:7947586-Alexandrium_andersonii.AAC.1
MPLLCGPTTIACWLSCKLVARAMLRYCVSEAAVPGMQRVARAQGAHLVASPCDPKAMKPSAGVATLAR